MCFAQLHKDWQTVMFPLALSNQSLKRGQGLDPIRMENEGITRVKINASCLGVG